MHRNTLLTACLLASMAFAHRAHAGESYGTCKNIVGSLPKTITTSGTWCMRQNLSSARVSGDALTIAADNVILDCNDFVMAGTVGSGSKTIGIHAVDRHDITIRHCNVQGFEYGAYLQASSASSSGGHLVEESRFEGNSVAGLRVEGDGSLVHLNLVLDTGGSTVLPNAYGIYGTYSVQVASNTVAGVAPHSGGNGSAYGIYATGSSGATIRANQVHGLARDGTGADVGIFEGSTARSTVRDNEVFGDGRAGSVGISCASGSIRAKSNVVDGYAAGLAGCGDAGDNDASH